MPATTNVAPLRVGVHPLVAASIGIVSPFTALAGLTSGKGFPYRDATQLLGTKVIGD